MTCPQPCSCAISRTKTSIQVLFHRISASSVNPQLGHLLNSAESKSEVTCPHWNLHIRSQTAACSHFESGCLLGAGDPQPNRWTCCGRKDQSKPSVWMWSLDHWKLWDEKKPTSVNNNSVYLEMALLLSIFKFCLRKHWFAVLSIVRVRGDPVTGPAFMKFIL